MESTTVVIESGTKAIVKRIIGYGVLIVAAIVFIYPFVLAATGAFKSLPEIQANPVGLFPSGESNDSTPIRSGFHCGR